MTENTFWAIFWGLAAAVGITIAVCTTYEHVATTRLAMEKGYVQQQRVGGDGTLWVKPSLY